MQHPLRRMLIVILAAVFVWQIPSRGVAADAPSSAKPVLVVFDFESSWDKGAFGKQVAEMFRGHAGRRGKFVLLDPISFAEILEGSHAKVGMASEPGKVAQCAKEYFDADVAIWGSAERLAADSYQIRVRATDRRENPETLALDEVYDSTKHGVVESVEKALDDLLGVPRKEPRDLLADTSWQTRKNLCVNGDFEAGEGSPTGWGPVDGMAIFCVAGESPTGRCIMLDTDVDEPQYQEWLKRFNAGAPASEAPARIPTKKLDYNTIAGSIGAHIYSDPIPIRQGQTYRVDMDYRGAGDAIAFIKGYASFIDENGANAMREVYRLQLNLKRNSLTEKDWQHRANLMHPTQPLHILPLTSGFDNGATGRKVRDLLLARLADLNAIVLTDGDQVAQRVKGREDLLHLNSPRVDIARVVRECLGYGVAVWGDVRQEEGTLKIELRSMDIRAVATTKWWAPNPWDIRMEEPGKTIDAIANAILTNARIVTHLRVKLDAYWPQGKYYFDNVWVTEEPGSAE